MNLARRLLNRQPPQGAEQLQGDEIEQQEELLPLEFVVDHQVALQESAAYWHKISCIAEDLQGEGAQQFVRQGIQELAASRGEHMPDNRERAVSAQAAADLSALSFLAARLTSGRGLMHSSLNMVKTMCEDLTPDLTYIASRKDGPVETYVYAATEMRVAINEADRLSAVVLDGLTDLFQKSPNSILVLDDLYSQGAELVDPDFYELREIIRTDWYAKDRSTSLLNKMIDSMSDDPDMFVEEFIENVIGTDGDKKMAVIQNMARFALADTATPESPEALRAVLLRNRRSWHAFEDIDSLLAAYQNQKRNSLKAALNSIAGPQSAENPRRAVTQEEFTEFKRKVRFDVSENRQKRRKSNGAGGTAVRRPNISKAAAVNERYDRTNKPIYFTKYTANSTLKKEMVDEDNTLEDNVRSRVADHLVDEIITCIKTINKNPIDRASRMILSKKGLVSIDGKKVRLRRFKPRDSQNCPTISREAASYRICYAVIDGSVVITDILTHDQFMAKF